MQAVDRDGVVAMLRGAARCIRLHAATLTSLDTAIGDGDHGLAMIRAMDTMEKTLGEDAGSSIAKLLADAGWAVMCIDGGSTGPLFGAFLTGLGEGAAERSSIDGEAFRAMLEAACAAIRNVTRATVGDKTLMDALLPAVECLRQRGDAGSLSACLQAAAAAAAQGAEATRSMRAAFGRARNLGDRAIGHMDPGAMSISLILSGFCQAIEASEQRQ